MSRLRWLHRSALAQPATGGFAAQGEGQRQFGPVSVSVNRYTASNAEPGAVVLAGSDRRYPAISARFIGACAEVIPVQMLVIDTPAFNLDAYLASRSGQDLPIHDLLRGIQQVLSERCATSKQAIVDVPREQGSAPVFQEAYVKARYEAATARTAANSAPAPAPPERDEREELQRRHLEAMTKLQQEYEAQLQATRNPLLRVKVEAEYQWKKSQLQRRYEEQQKQLPRR